jgi:hypothetical protein
MSVGYVYDEWTIIIQSINNAGIYGRKRIIKHTAIEFRKLAIQYVSTQNRKFSPTFIKKNIDGISQKILEKAYKTNKVKCCPLISNPDERRAQYHIDYYEFDPKFKMDNYVLDVPKDKKQ